MGRSPRVSQDAAPIVQGKSDAPLIQEEQGRREETGDSQRHLRRAW